MGWRQAVSLPGSVSGFYPESVLADSLLALAVLLVPVRRQIREQVGLE